MSWFTYSHLYGIPATGLRFSTVYGPYGRPDMAYFSFTKAILGGKLKFKSIADHNSAVKIFNYDIVLQQIIIRGESSMNYALIGYGHISSNLSAKNNYLNISHMGINTYDVIATVSGKS